MAAHCLAVPSPSPRPQRAPSPSFLPSFRNVHPASITGPRRLRDQGVCRAGRGFSGPQVLILHRAALRAERSCPLLPDEKLPAYSAVAWPRGRRTPCCTSSPADPSSPTPTRRGSVLCQRAPSAPLYFLSLPPTPAWDTSSLRLEQPVLWMALFCPHTALCPCQLSSCCFPGRLAQVRGSTGGAGGRFEGQSWAANGQALPCRLNGAQEPDRVFVEQEAGNRKCPERESGEWLA